MIDYKFYTENNKQKNLNLISGVVPQQRIISSIEKAYNYDGALFYLDSDAFNSTHIRKEVFLERSKKSLLTKILVDRSYETGLSEQDYNSKITQLAKLGIDTKDILFVLNRSAYHEWMDKHIDRIIFIDLFAVSAVIRHVIHKQEVSQIPVVDRPHKINFLVGKVNKPSRVLLLKKFFNDTIKEQTIFSILGTVAGVNDEDFNKFVALNQGPIDGANKILTNEGVSSQGWGESSKVYDTTSISFVCETHESNDSLFLTEKTYRPIINRHPFVIRASFPAIKYLNAIGFKTFGDHIDESYDEINNVTDDHAETLIYVSKELLNKIKNNPEQIQSIVDHNYRVLIQFAQSELDNLNKRLFSSLK